MRAIFLGLLVLLISGCSSFYPNQLIMGKVFPTVSGETLERNLVTIPNDFNGKMSLLLIGYKQDSQFDIDRWLIGLDMTETRLDVYELPTIQGVFPRMFSTMINNGMRSGIPKSLWKGVITIYEDGEKVQLYTGNDKPNNARVVLLDETGTVLYFYDKGFSLAALNKLRETLK
ncbi:hypothetical protein HQQ94_19000 [Shewanella sp. VB17]|uniref:hypothetical protein n=1 Tax=Shewanella sp. VB17 TaxID=2739432 RepID=UPI001565B324|nr:hypothetical protein [Shewanella sp. VB17]NRD75271.1 hypothetical protein [Shewanella sp. VB17]